MRELSLSSTLLDRLPPDGPTTAWAAVLRDQGLLSVQPGPLAPDAAWSPAQGLARVQAALKDALAADVAAQADAPTELPVAVWALVAGLLLVLILFAPLVVAVLGPGAIWGGLVFAVLVALFTVVDRRRRAAGQAARAARAVLRAALEDLTARTFVAVVDGTRLVCVPELEQARTLLEALILSDPDAPVRAALQQAVEAAEARLLVLRESPEAPWTDRGLRLDLPHWSDAIDQIA